MLHIEKKIQQYIDSRKMLPPHAKIIIALSGGADSIALLLVLSALGYDCHAAHCNFHLRQEESMRDEDFVTRTCAGKGIPLHKTDFDTEAYAKEKGISIEMAARDLRYAYFRKLKEEIGAYAIAVGHHKDDNAETIILNLTRGTGIQGLSGIQPINDDIVRPMLCISRKEILQYLKEKGQSYVTDSTNLQNIYSRNKVRLDIIPMLQTINPAALENITATIQNLNEAKKIYEAAIRECIGKCVRNEKSPQGNYIYINKEILTGCVSPSSVLHEILHPLSFNRSQEISILEGVENGSIGTVFESGNHTLTIDRDEIAIYPRLIEQHEDVPLEHCSHIETLEDGTDCAPFIRDKAYACIDADKINGHLRVRRCKTGDSFQPFGMKGRKLLSDYMTDRKYNRLQKDRQLVVYDESGEIVWLVGERISDRYRIDSTTTRILVLKHSK